MKRIFLIASFLIAMFSLYGCGSIGGGDTNVVIQNNLPVITAENVTVNNLETFDYTANVSAVDQDGNALDVVVEDTNIPEVIIDGIYYITYSATDDTDAKATKTINVIIDRTRPMVTVDTEMPTHLEVGEDVPAWEAFFVVEDNIDGEITVTKDMIASNVNIYQAGVYVVKLTVKDRAENTRTFEHVVTVSDYDAPNIYLSKASDTFEMGTEDKLEDYWRDFIVSVSDNSDEVSADDVIIDTNEIDYHTPGRYHVYYMLDDESGNMAYEYMYIYITDNEIPELILHDPTMYIEAGTTITDELFRNYILYAYDNADGNLFYEVNILYDEVDNQVLGTYTVNYAVIDYAGNLTEVNLDVIVIDTIKPMITSSTGSNESGEYILTANEPIYEYSIDNGNTWTELTYPSSSINLFFEDLGTYYIRIKDRGDNINELYTTYMHYDITRPLIQSNPITDETGSYTIISNELIHGYQINGGLWEYAETPDYTLELTFDALGSYAIRVMDPSLNISSSSVTYTFVDITNPNIISADETNETGIYDVISNEAIEAVSVDGGITWMNLAEPYQSSFQFSTIVEDTYTIVVRDVAGNISDMSIEYTYNDTSAPFINSEDEVNNDGSFIIEANEFIYAYSIDDGFSWIELFTPAMTYIFNTGLEDTYLIKVKDQAGLISDSVSYTFDNTLPVILDYSETTQTGIVTIEVDENVTAFSLNDGVSWTDVNPYAPTFSFTLTEEDSYMIDLVVRDEASNETSQTINVVYDATVPEIINGLYVTSNGEFYVEADEDIYRYSLDDGVTWTEVLPITIIDIIEDTEGIYPYDLIIEDIAGNQTSALITLTYDLTNPTIAGGTYASSTGNFSVEVDEDIYRYSLDNGLTWTDVLVPASIIDFVEDTEGVYPYNLVIEDIAGNQTTAAITFTYDETLPVINSIDDNGAGLYTVNASEDIYEYSIDNGINWVEVSPESASFNILFDTTGTYDIVVKDIAGNISTATQVIYA